jgi:hypothetical protein
MDYEQIHFNCSPTRDSTPIRSCSSEVAAPKLHLNPQGTQIQLDRCAFTTP